MGGRSAAEGPNTPAGRTEAANLQCCLQKKNCKSMPGKKNKNITKQESVYVATLTSREERVKSPGAARLPDIRRNNINSDHACLYTVRTNATGDVKAAGVQQKGRQDN